ncbi:hypothetical protein IAR55_000451 [Kwoniella newhampshirensis]|uniref:Uncharacterized protein n=1 Tax=Kwoniella newhampshirensis TaxID=1651941 RepID=A0AAW0Z6M9_9TREE
MPKPTKTYSRTAKAAYTKTNKSIPNAGFKSRLSTKTKTPKDTNNTKNKRKPVEPSSPRPGSNSDTATDDLTLNLDKDLVLKIIIAKLEASKTCDWHELSKTIGKIGHGVEKKAVSSKGGKGKKSSEEESGFSGTELHELYHHTILPALRDGRALWQDSSETQHAQSTSPSTAATSQIGPMTPPGEEDDEAEMQLDSEEETQVLKVRAERERTSKGNTREAQVDWDEDDDETLSDAGSDDDDDDDYEA